MAKTPEEIQAEKMWKLKMVMDETVEFPTEYLFKFIVPVTEVHQLLGILHGMDIDERASSGGKYISVSAKKMFNSSDEILKIYKSVAVVKGIISL
jgi:putative lipoic acid-binding regulatory protein